MCKFKARDSEENLAPFCSGNVLKDFSVDNRKRMDCMVMSLIFQLIMMVLSTCIKGIFCDSLVFNSEGHMRCVSLNNGPC